MVIEGLWYSTSFAENYSTVGDGSEYDSKPCRTWGIEETAVTHEFMKYKSSADKTRDQTRCLEKLSTENLTCLQIKARLHRQQWSEDGNFSLLQRPRAWTNREHGSPEEDPVLKNTGESCWGVCGSVQWSIATVSHIVKHLYSRKQWRTFELLNLASFGLPFDIIMF